MPIGYVGLGNMGSALAQRLASTHDLLVFDTSDEAVKRLVDEGATAADNLSDIAQTCTTIFVCLPTSPIVHQVVFGEGGLVHTAKPGTTIIDQTSGDPTQTRKMAAELAALDIDFIDAPVSGGVHGANAGTISIMVGASHGQFKGVAPLLASISPNIFHAGGVGNGHVIKLVNNLMSAAQRLLTFEAMALAQKNGVDPHVAHEVLMASGGRNAYLEKILGPKVLHGDLAPGFTLGLAHKDVRLACQLGVDSGVPMYIGNLVRELYQQHVNTLGADAQVDTAALAVESISQAQFVPSDAHTQPGVS